MIVKYLLNQDKTHIHTLKLSESDTLELLSLYKDLRALQFRVDLQDVNSDFDYYQTFKNRIKSTLLPKNNIIIRQLKIYMLDKSWYGSYFEYSNSYLHTMKLLKSIFVHDVLHLHIWNVYQPQNIHDFCNSVHFLLNGKTVYNQSNHSIVIYKSYFKWMRINTLTWHLQKLFTNFASSYKHWTDISHFSECNRFDTKFAYQFCKRMQALQSKSN